MSKTKKQTTKKKCSSCTKFSLARFLILTTVAVFLSAITILKFQSTHLLDVSIRRPVTTVRSSVEKDTTEDELYSSAQGGSEGAVAQLFSAYNNEDFKTACDVIDDAKCDASSTADVARFAQEYDKLLNGYNDVYVWTPVVTDFDKNVVCAQYNYQYNFDMNEKNIQETLSFYVSEEGKITARVCEEKLLNGEAGECPILSKRDFCLQ